MEMHFQLNGVTYVLTVTTGNHGNALSTKWSNLCVNCINGNHRNASVQPYIHTVHFLPVTRTPLQNSSTFMVE
jgi:hypothetical protein